MCFLLQFCFQFWKFVFSDVSAGTLTQDNKEQQMSCLNKYLLNTIFTLNIGTPYHICPKH